MRSLLLACAGVLLTLATRPVLCQEEPSVTCTCQRHPESVFHPNPQDACCAEATSDALQSASLPWLPAGPVEPPAAAQQEPSISAEASEVSAEASEVQPPPPALAPRREPLPARRQTAPPGERGGRAALRPWKWTTLAGGLVLAGGGAALLALDGRLGEQCWMPGDLSTCRRVLQTQPAGAVLVGVGAAGLVGALVLFTLDARHRPPRARSALVAHAERGGFSLTAVEPK